MFGITHIFTKLLQNEYLIWSNCLFKSIDMPDASYGQFIDIIAFFVYFHTLLMTIHVKNCYISTNFSQIVCQNVWYVNMSNVTGYERVFDLMLFENFHILLYV